MSGFHYQPRSADDWLRRTVQHGEDDSAQAVDFLWQWTPEGPWLLSAIVPDSRIIETREFTDPDAAFEWIEQCNGERNLYFSVNRTKPGLSRKASKADITALVALHVDLDPPKNGGDLLMAQAALLDRLKGHQPPPSVIVFSGGGYGAYWLLDAPVAVDGNIAELESYNIALAQALGGDRCHDICRIMRLPGTVNLPDARKRELGRVPALAEVVHFDPTRKYRLADFCAAEVANGARREARDDTHRSAPPIDPELAEIIRLGHDPDDPQRWHGDRSDAVFFVACELVRALWSDRRIAEVLLDKSNGISAHIHDQADPQRAAWRAIENAHEVLAKEEAEQDRPRAAAKREWPRLAPEAYHGLAGEIARANEPISEADPVAVLTQTLAMFGCAFGRRAWCWVGSTKHYPNLFEVICGTTAKGRKGTSYDPVEDLLIRADLAFIEKCVTSGLASGEGIIHAVHDDIWVREKVPQGGKGRPPIYQEVLKEPNITDKRLLIVEQEFALPLAAMARHGNTLAAVLSLLWDGRQLKTTVKHSPETATGAHGAIIAHINNRELVQRLNELHLASGFANRFLFILARRSKEIPFPPQLNDAIARKLADRMRDALDDDNLRGEITFDEDARAMFSAEYHDLSAGKAATLFGFLTARAEAQVLRLSMIYALLDRSIIIRPAHLRAALALWRYCEASARYIFGDLLGDPLADEILLALRQRQGASMTRTEINNLFKGNKTSAAIGQALALLFEHGLAEMTKQGGGRRQGPPVETWNAA
jgi:hypothetical protein